MPNFVNINEEGPGWSFRARDCIGCACWSPGVFYQCSGSGSAMRMTGRSRRCCLQREYHGCPDDDDEQREWDAGLANERIEEGWRPC